MPKRKASSKMWSSGRSKYSNKTSKKSASTIDETAANALFSEICDPDDHSIATMEGISLFCEQSLDIDPLEDVRVLVLLWKMEATSKPAQIGREEWMAACVALQVDSAESFKALLPTLETGFLDNDEFKDFYKFCFQFNREGTHKTLDKELVVMLLQLVLKDTNRVSKVRLDSFCQFLETGTKDYQRITLDQWTSFWDFSQEVVDDLSAYDEATSAWPVMIDEYVEYMEELQKKR